jgi:hypothetical protein
MSAMTRRSLFYVGSFRLIARPQAHALKGQHDWIQFVVELLKFTPNRGDVHRVTLQINQIPIAVRVT